MDYKPRSAGAESLLPLISRGEVQDIAGCLLDDALQFME